MTALSEIDRQIGELQAQKRLLIQEEKKKALRKVELAVKELNALGCNYSIADGGTPARARRTGVRNDVLEVVQKADGIKPADIAASLGMDGKAGRQSVANALSALKKAGSIVVDSGMYRSV